MRAAAISIAGIDLSHPAIPTKPSSRSANTTASTESVMISRLTSEARMPSWPIEMPSLTVIVPNSIGKPPESRTPRFTCSASARSVRLHGVISFHELATPIWGLSQSSSVIPTARSMARAGARRGKSVTSCDRGLTSTGVGAGSVLDMRANLVRADLVTLLLDIEGRVTRSRCSAAGRGGAVDRRRAHCVGADGVVPVESVDGAVAGAGRRAGGLRAGGLRARRLRARARAVLADRSGRPIDGSMNSFVTMSSAVRSAGGS